MIMKILYNKILNSISNEIKSAIIEQFSFNDIDFSDDESSQDSIFYKEMINIEVIYDKILNEIDLESYELLYLNNNISIFAPENVNRLFNIILYYSQKYPEMPLNWVDVSGFADMSDIFLGTKYNGDISRWDVSNVTNMCGMFRNTIFNSDISTWDVSNVINMEGMFSYSKFNNDISNWDVSNVHNMHEMFRSSEFNNDISRWDISSAQLVSYMFSDSSFNHDISRWNSDKIVRAINMFTNTNIKEEYKPKAIIKYINT